MRRPSSPSRPPRTSCPRCWPGGGRPWRGRAGANGAAPAVEPETARAATDALAGPRLLWALFATGLVSMAMEVVWVRLFTPYLGNVVYSFATILALYLAATFLGSRIYRARARSAVRL